MVAGAEHGRGETGSVPDPWADRVRIERGPRGAYAHRPGRLLVPRGAWQRLPGSVRERLLADVGRGDRPARTREADPGRGPVVLEDVGDVRSAAARFRDEGVPAQVDLVFFATPPGAVAGAPVMFGGVGGAPVMFGGVGGAPVMFGGVGGAPVMFGGTGPCGCWHPVVGPAPGTPAAPRTSTVRPAGAPPEDDTGDGTCRVVVVDTGLAADRFLPPTSVSGVGTRDVPDADDDLSLDAAAGHATFIAAIVERLAPDATVEVRPVLSTFGDGSDSEVADVLWELVDDPPQIVNLSFAGYSDDDAAPLAVRGALAALVAAGTVVVASAGNDSTCRPAWPASCDDVIAVGALGGSAPAWFTNHGPWVDACAPGVDVCSRFFCVPEAPGEDELGDVEALGDTVEWAAWSGTSFAAPIVAGVLARTVVAGRTPLAARRALIDDPALFRIPGLGTVVNERPW